MEHPVLIPDDGTCSTGVQQSREIFGADDVSDIKKLSGTLKQFAQNASCVYVDIPPHGNYPSPPSPRKKQTPIIAYLARAMPRSDYSTAVEVLDRATTRSLSDELVKLRKIKSPAERGLMRRAADVSGTAHAKVSNQTPP
jgi:intermediate cleaving peptidase 55